RREALGRAEIGAVERVVGAQHADEGQSRKVMALREHLRADQDVDFPVLDLLADRRKRALPARRVTVNARHPRAGECCAYRLLETLRAETERNQVDVAAFRTCARDTLRV